MAPSIRDSKGRELPAPGALSRGFEQDRDDAFLVNEIASAIADRTRHLPTQSVAAGLLAVNEDCRLTLPIFQQCLDTDDQVLRKEMVRAIFGNIRDLLGVASLFEKLPTPKDARRTSINRVAWYPFNALSVLMCWHFETAEKDSPVASAEHYLQSPLWGIMMLLYDNADSSDLSLPETLSWAAGRPDVETIRDLMRERRITSREEIESLLESQGNVAAPVRNGVL